MLFKIGGDLEISEVLEKLLLAYVIILLMSYNFCNITFSYF